VEHVDSLWLDDVVQVLRYTGVDGPMDSDEGMNKHTASGTRHSRDVFIIYSHPWI
jgi:hypothetical protein